MKAVFLALLLPALATAEPISEERQKGLRLLANLQFRLGVLRATLFEEHRWDGNLLTPYYGQRREAVALEEALDNPHTMPGELQRGVQAVKHNYQLLTALLLQQGASRPVVLLKEQIDMRVEDLETAVMTIPD